MPADSGSSLWSTFIMIGLMVAFFYLLIIKPTKRRNAQHSEMVSSLQVGSRVVTTAGILGTIRHLGTNQLVIEIAPEVEMTITKQAILRELKPDEEEFEYSDDDDQGGYQHEETGLSDDDVVDDDSQAR